MGKRRLGKTERFVSLRHWVLDSPAWLSLPCNARALYVQLAKRYNGANNGRISYSVREAYEELKISKSTAHRAFRVLQSRGFIVCTKRGAFSWKIVNEASEWRLTEYPNDCPPEHASKEFMRFRLPGPDSNEPPEFRTRVPRRNDTGTQVERHRYPSERRTPKKAVVGTHVKPRMPKKTPSSVPRRDTYIYQIWARLENAWLSSRWTVA